MKKVIEVNILGQRFPVQSEESEQYIRAVEDYLNRKIEEVRQSTKAVASLDLALLVALNVVGELMKAREMLQSVEKKSGELVERMAKTLP